MNTFAKHQTLRWFSSLLAVLAVVPWLGCDGSDAGCEQLCAIEADCASDTDAIPVDEEACLSSCRDLAAEDPEYAEAVEERAACLEANGCVDDSFPNECSPSGE
jgi:hypothetical protein